MQKSTFKHKKAFTLIELLIVITIIGILFIVLVSKVDFATDKAKASGVQTDFKSFQMALEMVSKENAGFNTFGWDTGDNGANVADSGSITLNGKSYTYTNATRDAGDRIRNSYDEGDTDLDGQYDDGEAWTGRKVYTETWTGCYTLINPGNTSDMSAIFDLETAINKNLDPKLHIVIANDGTITMANGYKDPWSTQYHGRYITNASADAAAKWNTDASMAGSIGDNMDRGAILMYSNGANQKFGTKVKIEKGVVTATISQIDANHPDNNKYGADDYVLAVVYSYTNGYGEIMSPTWGFSQNNIPSTGNGGDVNNEVTPGGNGGTLQLPAENPSGDLQDYYDADSWSAIKTLAQANLSKDDYKNKYGIEPGDIIISDEGTTYVLVDLGTDEGDYDGFVFMYNSGKETGMNDNAFNRGGYVGYMQYGNLVPSYSKQTVDKLFDNLTDTELQNVIKEVTITCNSGNDNANDVWDKGMSKYTAEVSMFLASAKEVGVTIDGYQYDAEGNKFDLFTTDNSSRAALKDLLNMDDAWWLRSANSAQGGTFHCVLGSGKVDFMSANWKYYIIPAFVIG